VVPGLHFVHGMAGHVLLDVSLLEFGVPPRVRREQLLKLYLAGVPNQSSGVDSNSTAQALAVRLRLCCHRDHRAVLGSWDAVRAGGNGMDEHHSRACELAR
jgi:hypothetical protein